MAQNAPPRWDRAMHLRLARGEAAALGELYDRYAPLVHGLAHRVLAEDAAADAITREVFARLWEHPDAYQPERGPLRTWLAELAHRLAVQRLRSTAPAGAAAARGDGGGAHERDRPGDHAGEQLERTVHRASAAARADYIVESMPVSLRAALELAYFRRRDCRQAAADLGITEDEAHRRLRLGLQLLATAHGSGPLDPPLGYDTPPDPADPSSNPGRTT
ncbi:RNA polymerase sigma factor [Streptomyces sulfonofaciens]|uniref:RNA polymerase sigma factor n=1 Tax=Streptomyces sulfonofaciens TaxID=68272 RepID=A0A919KQ32_9ACTN|nr:sigma-70 family RNA polymerase sigma factor [Streptomyces sulfonofaciens]GHH68935.1 RNA polymerase sigma factor [Streptomyces sulfonofaciens]